MKFNGNDSIPDPLARWALAALLASSASVGEAKNLVTHQIASNTHPADTGNAKVVTLGFDAFVARINALGGAHDNKLMLIVQRDRFDLAETGKAFRGCEAPRHGRCLASLAHPMSRRLPRRACWMSMIWR